MSANDGSEAMELGVWNTESATFTLEVAGALPQPDWTGDEIVRFSGKVKYTY